MCGCMFEHAAMDHGEHRQAATETPAPIQAAAASAKKCAHCGYSLQAGFAFCPSCGMRVGASRCPACGQMTEASWKTCAHCGSPLAQAVG